MKNEPLYLAIDLGAGDSTKIGLFSGRFPNPEILVAEFVLALEHYGADFSTYAQNLLQTIEQGLRESTISRDQIRGIGIATAGILRSDGSFKLVQNLSHFNDHNLKRVLEDAIGVPTKIENDANAGALAEWSQFRVPLLYWVFGGGWGGAWVDADGQIQYPALDWDGQDETLHYSNEPGYAIGLEKMTLKTLFYEVGGSFERFEQNLIQELGEASSLGPCKNPATLRAEVLLSGPGRCRVFRALVADDNFYERFLDIHETRQMNDPRVAGKHISKLSSMRVEAALNTDRLYGKILAHAARILLKQAQDDGLPPGVPICLGGKPSYALPYFGPSTQRILGRFGLMNYLRPSIIDERGMNANLFGAGVLGMQAAQENR